MVQRISKKLDSWKEANFSLRGSITLVHASLSSIPLYFPSLFKILVAHRIEKIMWDLWPDDGASKRDHWV